MVALVITIMEGREGGRGGGQRAPPTELGNYNERFLINNNKGLE